MTASTRTDPEYTLGSTDAEIARLDAQASMIADPTELLLRAAGVGAGMRVLDLGTGLGHVAFALAALVGPTGRVVGIDREARMLAIAEQRRAAAGLENVQFRDADVRTFAADGRFDAVIGRLILFHVPDPIAVIRHHARALAPGGRVIVVDFDLGTVRAEPHVPLVSQGIGWVCDAFIAGGANPVIGSRLGPILRGAGLTEVSTFGVQRYLSSDDPTGPALIAGVIRSLAPRIVAGGIATEDELELDTLPRRLADAIAAADAVVLIPDVVGAWGRSTPR